jgi:transcriptional regulator with PAS, ATPase and Fis domain
LEDLYYRLNDFPIAIPPLRERSGDVKLLIDHYFRKSCAELRRNLPGFSRQAVQIMQQYAWPGNVRELEKCVKRAVILAEEGRPVTVRHLPDELKSPEKQAQETAIRLEGLSLREHMSRVEADLVAAAMHKAAGNKAEAARLLSISYPSLLQKVKLYGPHFEEDPS